MSSGGISEDAFKSSENIEGAGDPFFVFGIGVHQFFETIWSYVVILAWMSLVAGLQVKVISQNLPKDSSLYQFSIAALHPAGPVCHREGFENPEVTL